jgi:small subunit ribosomal protein S1
VNDQSEDFAAMFEASTQAKRLDQGELVEGKVVSIGAEVALIDVGRKGEAEMAIGELKNADGELEVKLGDIVQAMVVSTSGGLKLSRRLGGSAASNEQFEVAFQGGLPVEGKVERAIKGGYEVRIGRRRAFCPISQIDLRGAEAAAHEGRVYQFRIIEYKEGGENIVVSRRALLEDEQRANASKLRDKIVVGAVLTGHVASVRDFGAFVDLGAGVQGLLHVSEMAWSRVSKPAEMVKPGDEITVKVLRVDGDKKIALGLKQLSADPWSKVAETYKVGQRLPGRVTRVAQFGAFVELEPGVEALAHASTFEPTGRSGGWMAHVTAGTTSTFDILSIDLDQKRIGVALVPEGSAGTDGAGGVRSAIVVGARVMGKVERHENFGVFVFLAPGRTGVIPNSETGVSKEGDLRRALPVGTDVEVIVQEIDAAGRRIRLSVKAVAEAREAEEVREWAERNAAPAEGSGTLADKLRSAFKSLEK